MFKRYILLCYFLINLSLLAQNRLKFSQFINSQTSINPAYAGARNTLSAILLHREQWTGINGSPRISSFNIHKPITEYNMGVGGSLNYETVGLRKSYNISAVFSYSLNFTNSTLNFGLSLGMDSYSYDNSIINKINSDKSFNNNLSYSAANFGFGLYYYTNDYFVGFSTPQILYTAENYNENNKSSIDLSKTPIYLYSGYVFDISFVKIKPSILIETYTSSDIRYDVGVTTYLPYDTGVGAFYRSNNDIILYAEIKLLESLTVSYSYDYSIGNIGSFGGGSHEIGLRYDLTIKKRVRSMRYF